MNGLPAFIVILVISSIVFFLVYNLMSSRFRMSQKTSAADHRKLVDQVARLEAERRDLAKELAELEKQLTFLKHDIKPSAAITSKIKLPDSAEEEDSIDTRMADYMVTQGIITMEQCQKAIRTMERLQMDFTAVCLTLGFITVEQASSIKKQIKK